MLSATLLVLINTVYAFIVSWASEIENLLGLPSASLLKDVDGAAPLVSTLYRVGVFSNQIERPHPAAQMMCLG